MNKKNNAYWYIFALQSVFCLLIIFSMLIIKTVNKGYYNKIKTWVNFQLNDSLIVENEQKIKRTELFPVKLSVSISEPVKNSKITSKFGPREDPFCATKKTLHKGLDLGANLGDSIFSVFPGEVELAKNLAGYGRCVIINHGNKIKSLYAHCQKIEVSAGEYVNKNQKIATVGATGKATGPHLHFGIIIEDVEQNPEIFIGNLGNENKSF